MYHSNKLSEQSGGQMDRWMRRLYYMTFYEYVYPKRFEIEIFFYVVFIKI